MEVHSGYNVLIQISNLGIEIQFHFEEFFMGIRSLCFHLLDLQLSKFYIKICTRRLRFRLLQQGFRLRNLDWGLFF